MSSHLYSVRLFVEAENVVKSVGLWFVESTELPPEDVEGQAKNAAGTMRVFLRLVLPLDAYIFKWQCRVFHESDLETLVASYREPVSTFDGVGVAGLGITHREACLRFSTDRTIAEPSYAYVPFVPYIFTTGSMELNLAAEVIVKAVLQGLETFAAVVKPRRNFYAETDLWYDWELTTHNKRRVQLPPVQDRVF